MLNKTFRGSFIDVRGEDGSMVRIRASQINLVQIPPSRLAINPKEIPNALVIIGNTPMHFPVLMGEAISEMLDQLDNDAEASEAAKRQNITELNGRGPSRN